MKRVMLIVAAASGLFSGCAEMNQIATGVATGVKASLTGENIVIGTVEVSSPFPGYVTCFKDVPGSAISRRPITNINEAEGFPSLIVTKSGVMSAGSCAELQKNGLLVASSGSASGNAQTGKPANSKAFSSTELPRFFEKHPQPGGGKTTTWPRVAITLLEEPSWGRDKLSQRNNFKYPSFGCWKFKAKIWESEKTSRNISAFHHCTDEGSRFPGGDRSMIYQVWSGIVTPQETRGSTGTKRTEGPNFPDNPLPVKPSNRSILNPVTFTGNTIEHIMHETGIDMNKPDPRLWLNLGAGIDGSGHN